jgi:hypothetical protein
LGFREQISFNGGFCVIEDSNQRLAGLRASKWFWPELRAAPTASPVLTRSMESEIRGDGIHEENDLFKYLARWVSR